MNDLEVLKGGEKRLVGERAFDQILELSGVREEAVSGVDSQLLTDRPDHASYFPLKV